MQVLYGTGGISMIYLELLWSFMQVGLFSIGGGYAAIPLIQHQAIEVHSWLTMQEFADIMTISEMTPGPITINSATFVGIRVAGIPGAIVATLGCIIPSAIIVLLLAYVYYHWRGLDTVQSIFRSLRPCVIAMIDRQRSLLSLLPCTEARISQELSASHPSSYSQQLSLHSGYSE